MFGIVYITASTEKEARKITKCLLTERLVACVNYFPISSQYWWNDKIECSKEYLLICKTTKKHFKKIKKRVKELHSYENPEILLLPISAGQVEFLKWIKKETKHSL